MFVENELLKLLRIEADELATAFEKAKIEGKGTPQDIADRRELAFKNLLER